MEVSYAPMYRSNRFCWNDARLDTHDIRSIDRRWPAGDDYASGQFARAANGPEQSPFQPEKTQRPAACLERTMQNSLDKQSTLIVRWHSQALEFS